MLEYISIIAAFISGGGITTLISLRYMRKGGKLDYTEKAIAFIEKQYDDVLARNQELSDRITALEKLIPIACFKLECEKRMKEDDTRKRRGK